MPVIEKDLENFIYKYFKIVIKGSDLIFVMGKDILFWKIAKYVLSFSKINCETRVINLGNMETGK